MKIAVASENGQVARHFGLCEEFNVFYTSGRKIIREETIRRPGIHASFLPNYLSSHHVQVVIAGKMRPASQKLLEAWGIAAVTDVPGDVQQIVRLYLEAGTSLESARMRKSAGHESARS